MNFLITEMNNEKTKEVLSWKYEKPYDFYNNDESDEEFDEKMDGSYFCVIDDQNKLVGFFCTGESAQVPKGNKYHMYQETLIDLGLGMNPRLTGKGNGFEYCSFIIKHIEETYQTAPIRLTVAKFNHRAIHLYQKLGFVYENEFITDYAEFMTLIKRDRNTT